MLFEWLGQMGLWKERMRDLKLGERLYLLDGGWKWWRQWRWLGLCGESRGCMGWCSWATEAKWESCHWKSRGGSECIAMESFRERNRKFWKEQVIVWRREMWGWGREVRSHQLQTQSLSPHVINGSGNNWRETWTLGRPPHSTDLISHVINSLTCEPFKPMD